MSLADEHIHSVSASVSEMTDLETPGPRSANKGSQSKESSLRVWPIRQRLAGDSQLVKYPENSSSQ